MPLGILYYCKVYAEPGIHGDYLWLDWYSKVKSFFSSIFSPDINVVNYGRF